MKTNKLILTLAALTLAALATANAQMSLSLSLDTPGSTLTGETGPFGTYAIALQDSGHATITVTAAPGWKVGGNALTGQIGDSIWIKENIYPTSGGATYGDGVGLAAGQTGSQFIIGGPYDGYTLLYTPGGYDGAFNQIVVSRVNANNSWNSVFDVIQNGSEAWAFFYKTADNGTTKGYAMAPVTAVPEPSTFSLVCLGLAGLALYRRRKV